MTSDCFWELKKLYDDIQNECLSRAILDAKHFSVYEDVLKICYDLLVDAKRYEAVFFNKNEKMSCDREMISDNFNKFYGFSKYDNDCDGIDGERVVFSEWKSGENAYKDLQDFSFEMSKRGEFNFERYFNVFREVLDSLKKQASILDIKEAVSNNIKNNSLL